MKGNFYTKQNSSRKQLYIIRVAVLLATLFFSAWNLYADNLDDCLMEALENVDDSITVGQLREQYQQKTGKSSTEKPAQGNSVVNKNDVSMTNTTSDKVSLPASENGPTEIILKTSQARKPAYFPHKRHQDMYSCEMCHHDKNSSGKLVKYTSETTILKCAACHNTDMPNEELNSFKLIGHKLCRECHRKNQDITSAKCSTCHRKNL